MNIIIPMAGLSTRFHERGNTLPKPLITAEGKTLLRRSVETLGIDGKYIFITRRFDNEKHNELLVKEFESFGVDYEEVRIDSATKGAAETCLFAKDYIKENSELIITNCDQHLEWDSNKFLKACRADDVDGAVLTFESSDPKNSFCRVGENGNIIEVAEKKSVSNKALVGVHYWRRARDFFLSANKTLKNFIDKKRPECYISETYNYLITDSKKIIEHSIEKNGYFSLGTPDDLNIFLGKRKEFFSLKPLTLLIDIDGTILKHAHEYDKLGKNPQILPGVREKMNQWDSLGHTIILISARKESARALTIRCLEKLSIPYDQLIMGLTSGIRFLINDKLLASSEDRAKAINLITDSGLEEIHLK